MSRRSRDKEHIRNIQKSKDSFYVTIPIDFMREFGWRVRQKVVVKKDRGRLIVSDWKK